MSDIERLLQEKIGALDMDMQTVYRGCLSAISNKPLDPHEIIWCIDNKSLPCKEDEREELKEQMHEFLTAMAEFGA